MNAFTRGTDSAVSPKVVALMRKARGRPSAGWKSRYLVGVELSKHLTPVATYEEVAAALGTTQQRAYWECMTALGALACRLYARFEADAGGVPP